MSNSYQRSINTRPFPSPDVFVCPLGSGLVLYLCLDMKCLGGRLTLMLRHEMGMYTFKVLIRLTLLRRHQMEREWKTVFWYVLYVSGYGIGP